MNKIFKALISLDGIASMFSLACVVAAFMVVEL